MIINCVLDPRHKLEKTSRILKVIRKMIFFSRLTKNSQVVNLHNQLESNSINNFSPSENRINSIICTLLSIFFVLDEQFVHRKNYFFFKIYLIQSQKFGLEFFINQISRSIFFCMEYNIN